MPTKRRKVAPRLAGMTTAAIEAWQAGNYVELHPGLGPVTVGCQPATTEHHGAGCDRRTPEQDAAKEYKYRLWHTTWPKAQALQREFLTIAGKPRRPRCRPNVDA